jgi:hypothetical protein
MNCLHIVKKTNKIYIWLFVDINKDSVVEIEVTENRKFNSYFPITKRLKSKYNINY